MKSFACAFALSLLPGLACAQEGAARPNPPVLKELSTEFPKDAQLEARVLTATLVPGTLVPGMTSPWHTHATPVVVYVVEGTFTLEFKDREPVVRKAGEALLEPINVVLRAANNSQTEITRVVIFQVSSPNVPFMHPVH
jgi:quercetin dioxygenase-like cupin family protein